MIKITNCIKSSIIDAFDGNIFEKLITSQWRRFIPQTLAISNVQNRILKILKNKNK